MNESLTVPERTLVALSPGDLSQTQAQLVDWCWLKMRALGQEYRELSANLTIAKRNRWSRGGLITAVKRTKQRIQYYQKMRLAVQAGYLIIPNFPVELLAVRVQALTPRSEYGTYPTDVNVATPECLPAGVGRYVDETKPTRSGSREVNDPNGKTHIDYWARSNDYSEEIDMPVLTVKPMLLQAVESAMALKLFDQIGIAHGGPTSSRAQRRADPILVGQILQPKIGYEQKRVTFFLGWWLDTRTL